MDDLAGLGKVGVQLIQTGEKFLEKLLGPYLEERGEMLADSVRAKRRLNLATIAGMASQQVGDVEIRQIPGRVLFPLLEGASNEDDPGLQRKWAALLANAANPSALSGPYPILPAYAEILKQLVPIQAHILEMLNGNVLMIDRGVGLLDSITRDDIRTRFDLSIETYAVLVEDLNRLQLIHDTDEAFETAWTHHYNKIALTALGIGFLIACQPPEARIP